MFGLGKTKDSEVTKPASEVDLDVDSESTLKLVREAEQGNTAEQALTVRQALGKYKKATAWAMALSVCLVMDGFDVSLTSRCSRQHADTDHRLLFLVLCTVRPLFNDDLVYLEVTVPTPSPPRGSQACRMPPLSGS